MTLARIVFAGTGSFAVPALQALVQEKMPPVLVISNPARPSGKKGQLLPSPVELAANSLNLPVATPERIEQLNASLINAGVDLLVVADYGQIIPSSTLAIPKHGAINLHPSLLPRHRGPAPIVAALLAGETETGVTIIQMDDKMDHGPIISEERLSLTGRETAPDLKAVLAQHAARLLIKIMPLFIGGAIQPREQDHTRATYHRFLKRTDGEINWTESTVAIERKFRALQPWPGVWFKINIRGKEKIIKLLDLELWMDGVIALKPGVFFWQHEKLGLAVADGALRLKRLQVEGGPSLTADQFYCGYQNLIFQK